MVDVQSEMYLIMVSLWCGVDFERLAICSHEHFGFVILENLTWKMIFAELHFSSNVFFLLRFCRNRWAWFKWDMLYVELRLAGRLFIDSFTPTNHSCHPRNALYSLFFTSGVSHFQQFCYWGSSLLTKPQEISFKIEALCFSFQLVVYWCLKNVSGLCTFTTLNLETRIKLHLKGKIRQ